MKFRHLFPILGLALSCQSNDYQSNEAPQELPRGHPIVEVVEQKTKPKQNLEETVKKEMPQENLCVVDISNHFIPYLLDISKDRETYFTREGIFSIWVQRQRFGIFDSFPKEMKTEMLHYKKALERRKKEKFEGLPGSKPLPDIKLERGTSWYTTPKTERQIKSLEERRDKAKQEQKDKLEKHYQEQADKLKRRVEMIKNIQLRLRWEGFYNGEINGVHTGIGSSLMKYKRFHQRHLNFRGEVDGKLRWWSGIQDLLNRDLEEYSTKRFMRVLRERVKNMKCLFGGNAYLTPVIEEKELDKLVDRTADQLGLYTIDEMLRFFDEEHDVARVRLEIPERYKQEYMKFYVEVEKWEKDRKKTKLKLYAIEESKKVLLWETRAVVGGEQKLPNKTKKKFVTPTGTFYVKSFIAFPHWHPPVDSWSDVRYDEDEPETQPGPQNAFGVVAVVMHKTSDEQKYPYRGWQEDDAGFRNHSTASPWSVERGGSSHSCIRIHPSEIGYFIVLERYTPHIEFFVQYEGREILKHTPTKGTYIPIKGKKYFIPYRICDEVCKDEQPLEKKN